MTSFVCILHPDPDEIENQKMGAVYCLNESRLEEQFSITATTNRNQMRLARRSFAESRTIGSTLTNFPSTHLEQLYI